MVTLRTLAKVLNVHVTTVSRVLNGTEEEARAAAAPDTVRRIRELAEELHYRPNLHAISLRTKKTRTIGVLIPRLTDIVVATAYEGIDAAAAELKYVASVSNTGDVPERQRELGESALDRRVEGLIIADARSDSPEFIDELAARNVPFILVNRRVGEHCSITCDDVAGGRLAAEHLLQLGHRDIAVLAGETYTSTGVARCAGFVSACREHGIDIPADRILTGPFHTDAGRLAGEQLLSRKSKPTAIFAVNDFLAIGLMSAMRDHGIQAGADIAVVGFNDTPIAAALPVGLTSVRSFMHEMGYRATQVLLKRIAGEEIQSESLAPELIVRASSAPEIAAKRRR